MIHPPPPKRASLVQYGYRESGTHAGMFSQTLERENSKNEIRQRNRRRQTAKREYEKTQSEHEIKKFLGLAIARAHSPPEVATLRGSA